MHPFIRFLLRAGGIFFILCGVVPLIFYGIRNSGTIAMLAIGILTVLLPTLWRTWLSGHPRLRTLVGMGGCIALVFLLTVSVLIARRAWFNPPPDDGKAAVIVLGAKIEGDYPSLMLARRLNKAAEYLERNPQAYCVVSGGQGADEAYPEGEVMKNYLLELGVAPERIRVESRSTNTQQNLRYSKALLDGDEEHVVIVTDSFHGLRASIFAGSEGLATTYNLSSLTPWGLMPSYWLREILGVCWAWVSIRFGLE